MLRSASEGGRSLTPSVRSGHQIPVHGTGPYSLVDNGEVTDPLLQETLEQENERTPHTDDDLAWLAELPWYRRPHPAWLYPLILIFSMAGGILLAPRMEMYLSLICDDLGLAPAPGSSGRAHIPSQECRQSPMAQRQLSMLQLVLLLTNGIGSAFTSGFWSRLSDRKGRNAIMMVNVLGIFAMDVVVLIVSRNTLHELPMGSYFLAIGTMIEGCLGGYSAVNAMSLCYISDVTRSGTRARLFAVTTGVMFSGVAIGPSVGGHLTAATGDVVITLWISAMLHAVIILVLPFFPESLNQVRRDEATRAHKETQANAPHASAWERLYKAALAPFRSLRILMPERICDEYSQLPEDPDVPPSNVQLSLPHVFGSCTCDINMLLVSLAYFLESMTIAIVPVKIQYVQLVFNWSSEMLGLFMSYTALSRMLMLVAVLPLLIPLVHRPLASIVLPQDAAGAAPDAGPTSLDAEGRARAPPPPSAEPEASNSRSAAEHRLEQQWVQRAKILRLMHDTRMDVRNVG